VALPTINPLFLGLLIGGIVLVIGVVIMNWLQERRVRRRIDAAFRKPADSARDTDRVEPMFHSEDAPAEAPASASVDPTLEPIDDEPMPADVDVDSEPLPSPPSRAERGALAPDPDIESVVTLQPAQAVATQSLAGVLSTPAAKPVRWVGRRGAGLPWQALDAGASGPWQELAACMLIANRAGAATRGDIEAFVRATQEAAARLRAECDAPDAASEAARAEELDRFCADLDVQIGLTLLRSGGGQIAGTRLRGVAEAAGFKLSAAGQFDYIQDETGTTLYSLQNYKQEPFTIEGLRVLSAPGVILLLDVPRVAEPVRVFDQMRLVAKRMAQTLEAVLVDDNRRPLNDASLAAIRAQVQATATALREAHIEPGGPRALRLFG
jgi:FtsZ-interacting cell division protein ZipA